MRPGAKATTSSPSGLVSTEVWIEILKQGGADEASDILAENARAVREAGQLTRARVAFARLGRLVPRVALEPSGASAALAGVQSELFFAADVVARIGLLVAMADALQKDDFRRAVTTFYRTGSDREQQSVLRALPWLPEPARFAPLASEACRTNDVHVFSALCSDNPFSQEHMSDAAVFQMVLKALFLGVDTARTVGLEKRVTAELVRMVSDFAEERRAAGRSVPPDVQRIQQLWAQAQASAS